MSLGSHRHLLFHTTSDYNMFNTGDIELGTWVALPATNTKQLMQFLNQTSPMCDCLPAMSKLNFV